MNHILTNGVSALPILLHYIQHLFLDKTKIDLQFIHYSSIVRIPGNLNKVHGNKTQGEINIRSFHRRLQ